MATLEGFVARTTTIAMLIRLAVEWVAQTRPNHSTHLHPTRAALALGTDTIYPMHSFAAQHQP